MTDLEITKLCAEAIGQAVDLYEEMEYIILPVMPDPLFPDAAYAYDPLHNDSQAMALVKRFKIECTFPGWSSSNWVAAYGDSTGVWDKDPNRAICECVAKIQAARSKQTSASASLTTVTKGAPDVQT